ncbi:MAG: peptidase domain-containing ABC transporter [Pseudomonadota bacterium]|nr:peptidase domain-containing ABC transporter [Pseudomonadota bacterium]
MSLQLSFSGRRRTPLILQSEATECGLACVAMVAGFHGHVTDLATLRQRDSVSARGATMAHLMQIAARLDLASRPVKIEIEGLGRLPLPVILHWDFNHFVVLVAVRAGRYVIHDPALGERTLPAAELSNHFTGVCLQLTPTPQFKPQQRRTRVSLFTLLGNLQAVRTALLQILLMATALEVFALLSPFFMQWVVDQAILSADRELLSVLGLGFLLLALIQVAITGARAWVLMVLGTTLNAQLVTNLFGHLLRLPVQYFQKRHLGDITSRFESLNVIQRTLTSSFIEAIVDGFMAVVTLAVMFVYSAGLAVIVCLAALSYAALRILLYRPTVQAQHEQIAHDARQQSSFLETVRGIQSVKLFNRQSQRHTVHQNLLVDSVNAGIRMQRLTIAHHAARGLLFGVENIAVVWLGALLVMNGPFSVGMLFAFMAFKLQFVNRVSAFIDKAIEFRMLGLHAERVADVALHEPEPHGAFAGTLASLAADVELRNVTVRYSQLEAPVLQNVSLRIAEGESVAIVGPSGCGKTTLLKVILGILPPSEGEVLIGGVSLGTLGPRHRELIGTVMQEDDLFAGSIADNITFFDVEPDRARIEDCARMAAIHNDIVAMPMGYNTLIGDMGASLSGGQKQRVLLARALYKQPRILALDEATSHLDVACERSVNEAVRALKLTRIVIAHRPETIHMAGRVISLQNRRVETHMRPLASAG